MEQHATDDNSRVNFFLIFFAGLFKILTELSLRDWYDVTFSILSLISLVLIIVVNFDKARERFKRKC